MLKSGYIVACGSAGNGIHIRIEDTYDGERIQMDVYTDEQSNPVRADIIWNDKRCLSIDVSAFSIV